MGNNTSLYANTIKKCSLLFDSNTYPVTLISNLNTGGHLYISLILLEILSPFITSKKYSSLRKTDTFLNYLDSNNEEAWDINCEIKSLKQLFENGKLIDYGK